MFNTMSHKYNLPDGLLASVCYTESKYKINAVHHHDGNGDSIGICQIKLSTAQLVGFKGTEKDLLNPKVNIEYAAKYLSRNMKRYNGNIERALIAYNQGSAKDLTTTKYSDKVTHNWRGRYVCSTKTR